MTKIRFVRLAGILLTLILATSVLPLSISSHKPARAQGLVQARVTPDNLVVRTQPGTDSPMIDTFPRNTVLAIEGRENQLGNGGIWVFGSPVNGGTQGWVLSDYLEFPASFVIETLPIIDATGAASGGGEEDETPPPVPVGPEGSLAGMTLNPVNFRTGPGLNYSIIRTLSATTPVAAIGRNNNNTWFQVVVGDQEGWLYYTLVDISGNYAALPVIEVEPPAGGGGASVGAPGYSSANLGVFSYGAHVQSFSRPDLMHYAGMTWVKVQVRYGRGQSPGSVAGLINNAHALGFRILLGVVGSPGDVLGGEAYFNEYASFVGGAAALGADAIEIWNETNLAREWPQGHINPALYTQLLALSYNAIKANNTGTIVISAAPAPTGAEGAFGLDTVWNDNRYLAGMRDAGAGAYMDCLGAHYNEGIVSPTWTSGDPRGDNYYTRYFWGMVNTYRSLFPGKPICFTELGYLSPEGYGPPPPNFAWAINTSVAEQALWIDQVISLARNSGTVKLVIIWNMDFTGTHGGDPMGGYALIRPNGTCPACDALAN